MLNVEVIYGLLSKIYLTFVAEEEDKMFFFLLLTELLILLINTVAGIESH